MCRLAAYSGPPIGLGQFMLDTPHSLLVQAYAPTEMESAVLNADGFGVGWFNQDGQPATYKSMAPAWADPNLPELGRSLYRSRWFANVRSATDPFTGGLSNTQPFTVDGTVFLHNGFISDFADGIRGTIRRWLHEAFEHPIAGNTDSEYLFAVWRQLKAQYGDNWAALFRAFVDRVDTWAGDRRVLLNLIVDDGERMGYLRHALNGQAPTLYMTDCDPAFPRAHVVASEPLTDRVHWRMVPEGTLSVVHRDGHCEQHSL